MILFLSLIFNFLAITAYGFYRYENRWVKLQRGCEMPNYDEIVLWYTEDGNTWVEALDKDGNPWLYGEEAADGFKWPKATHWRKLPKSPK